jgi:hypothetical protein
MGPLTGGEIFVLDFPARKKMAPTPIMEIGKNEILR